MLRYTVVLYLLAVSSAVQSLNFVSLDNVFLDPKVILAKNFNPSTQVAQDNIVQFADALNAQGPWNVTSKPVMPPSGNKHDYLSYAPYFWPDCSNVHNTTELTQQEMFSQCNYVNRDGLINPDRLLPADEASFNSLADATLFSSLAWVITGDSKYSKAIVSFINAWFINPDTKMNPNLNYAQMERGPGGQIGTHTGLLDFKCMAKLVTGILILREGQSADWTQDVDSALVNWTTQYISWTQTAKISIEEELSANNHGTFWFNQVASLQILVGDTAAALDTLTKYFTGIYKAQIIASGEQPFEASRTRPYHYRAYNLAAMITNAELAKHVGYDGWGAHTSAGANIQGALNFAMTVKAAQNETNDVSEIYPEIATIASVYGDSSHTYSKFLAAADPQYPAQPYFFFNQPFTDSGLRVTTTGTNTSGPISTNNSSKHTNSASSLSMSLVTIILFCATLVYHTAI